MADHTVEDVLESYPAFAKMVDSEYLTTKQLTTLQVNVGYRCNIACRHCHYSCGPNRTEEMSREVMQACLDAYDQGGFTTMDITGGAPEMNPHLEWFMREAHARLEAPPNRAGRCERKQSDSVLPCRI